MDDFKILLCVLLPFLKTRIFFIKISCMAAGAALQAMLDINMINFAQQPVNTAAIGSSS
jgi:hypothetical protein